MNTCCCCLSLVLSLQTKYFIRFLILSCGRLSVIVYLVPLLTDDNRPVGLDMMEFVWDPCLL